MQPTTITSGSQIDILAGETVEVEANSELVVQGRLRVLGNSQVRVVFRSPTGTTWKGIRFEGSAADGSTLQYCDIIGATEPVTATNVSNLSINQLRVSGSNFGYDAALRFYNSSPTITNSEIIGQSNSWNGIRFASGSTGSISNSIIRDCGAGNGIVIEGGSNPSITNVTVQNNHHHGIILVNNYIEGSGGGDPLPIASPVIEGMYEEPPPSSHNGPMVQLVGNQVLGNGIVNGVRTYVGVDAYNSWCDLTNNTISASNYGIYADTYGYITGGHGLTGHGANFVRQNLVGLAAYNASWIILGDYLANFPPDPVCIYPGGCNEVINDSYNIISNEGSHVSAKGNWWGEFEPNQSKFSTGPNSTLDWYPARQNDYDCLIEWQGPTASEFEEGMTTAEASSEFEVALAALSRGENIMARDLFQYIMDRSTGSNKRAALLGLYRAKSGWTKLRRRRSWPLWRLGRVSFSQCPKICCSTRI